MNFLRTTDFPSVIRFTQPAESFSQPENSCGGASAAAQRIPGHHLWPSCTPFERKRLLSHKPPFLMRVPRLPTTLRPDVRRNLGRAPLLGNAEALLLAIRQMPRQPRAHARSTLRLPARQHRPMLPHRNHLSKQRHEHCPLSPTLGHFRFTCCFRSLPLSQRHCTTALTRYTVCNSASRPLACPGGGYIGRIIDRLGCVRETSEVTITRFKTLFRPMPQSCSFIRDEEACS
jgi:hypothetical protein